MQIKIQTIYNMWQKFFEFSHSKIDDQPQSIDNQIHNEESKICIFENE
jgi:hypothetical protein